MKDYCKEISRWIDYAKRGIRTEMYLSIAIDKLCWCRKFNKITEGKFNNMADQILSIQEGIY